MGKSFSGKKVLVAGLDKSGIGAVKYFTSMGAKVTVTDLRSRIDLQKALGLLKDIEIQTEFGRYNPKTFSDSDLVVLSMKAQHDERVLSQARAKNVNILTEYEFTAPVIKKPVICVTGTNGKSTATVLLSEAIRHTGKKAFIAGHIGKSIYEYLIDEDSYDYLILELDSDYFRYAQKFAFSHVILTNISDEKLIERSNSLQTFEDHINLYRTFINTVSKNATLVYSRDCENVFSVVSHCKTAKNIPFSLNFEDGDVVRYTHGAAYLKGHELVIRTPKTSFKYDLFDMKMKGLFNKENFMAAMVVAKDIHVTDASIEYVLTNFAGVEHRMEFVMKKDNVVFYNDARASSIKGLMRSLNSFEKPIILIAGGKDRGEDYGLLADTVAIKVKSLILMGESKEKMNRAIGDYTETFVVGTFEEAVILAFQKSKSGDTILYSPGCLPQDNSNKIENRGKHYKELIRSF